MTAELIWRFIMYSKMPIIKSGRYLPGAGREYVRIVGEGLRKLMGCVKLCHEEELTRAVLLEFLKSQEKSKR